jgi:hypothetical protein
LFISLLTAAAIGLNLWFIPMWGVTGSACATLLAYVVYFTPLLALLWVRMGVGLFSRKQVWVLLFTAALFGLNCLWDWLVSPLFGLLGDSLWVMVLQAAVRTGCLAVIAVAGIARMDVSAEVNALIGRIPLVGKKR